ncbi:MAG: FeoB-associated Cys-rich membrane protein [Flavobacteriaceae bacterium TMED120]|nr:MAG: FeoB-associated Cys-rich membrane protein [Flavobacteriaceae bacterium TMED120]HCQ24875.1 FeoB-associated Cys-rich membrane protein [Flavobacteriaceae bacterium]
METVQVLFVSLSVFFAVRLLYRRFFIPSKSDSNCDKNCDC